MPCSKRHIENREFESSNSENKGILQQQLQYILHKELTSNTGKFQSYKSSDISRLWQDIATTVWLLQQFISVGAT